MSGDYAEYVSVPSRSMSTVQPEEQTFLQTPMRSDCNKTSFHMCIFMLNNCNNNFSGNHKRYFSGK